MGAYDEDDEDIPNIRDHMPHSAPREEEIFRRRGENGEYVFYRLDKNRELIPVCDSESSETGQQTASGLVNVDEPRPASEPKSTR